MSTGFWSDRPQPSGDDNVKRCMWCFAILMNLHDFVGEVVLVHSFHDVHTVSFCLTADQIATGHMSFFARIKPTHSFRLLLDMCCMGKCAVLVAWHGSFRLMDCKWESLATSMEFCRERVVETFPWSRMNRSILDACLVE